MLQSEITSHLVTENHVSIPEITIGLVTALPVESAAMRLMVDKLEPIHVQGDRNLYSAGQVPSRVGSRPHGVVLARQTRDGTREAAAIATGMARSFPHLRHVVMVGIAGGMPQVGKGDVVTTSEGLVDYGHLRIDDQGPQLRRSVTGLSPVLQHADGELATVEFAGRRPWLELLQERMPTVPAGFHRPSPGEPKVFRALIGSADWLLRNGRVRDDLAARYQICAVEMEGSGIAVGANLHGLDWYVVRGIADYADATKTDEWHGYAALVAAAYTRALLAEVAPTSSSTASPVSSPNDGLAAIVEALVGLPLMRDDQQRRAMLSVLPDNIRMQIPDNSSGRLHIIAIVQTCQRFEEGATALLSALRLTLGAQSSELKPVVEAVERYWAGP
jgi:nucleoside phosphorylase